MTRSAGSGAGCDAAAAGARGALRLHARNAARASTTPATIAQRRLAPDGGIGTPACRILAEQAMDVLLPEPHTPGLHALALDRFLFGTAYSTTVRCMRSSDPAPTALGGAGVPLPDSVDTRFGLGLEWFAINLLVLALVFVPLERALPQCREQRVFRPEWTTDGAHFLISHLLVQAFSWAALFPSRLVRDTLIPARDFALLGSLPLPVQFLAVLALADLTQYWIHRCFHRLPFLWRLHAVHHSSMAMDWLAGSRMHPLDALATRAGAMTVVVLAGAPPSAVALYLAFVSFHAVFIHANFGAGLEW